MFNFDQEAVQKTALEALNKIRSKNNDKLEKEKLLEENLKSFDYSKRLLEEYNEDAFKDKLTKDIYFYNLFLKNCNDELALEVQQELGKYIQIIKEVYEFINVKPKAIVYEVNLNMNDIDIEKKSKEIIHEHLQRNFYNLSKSEITKKFKNAVVNEAYSLSVEEDLEPEKSVEAVTKSLVIENMLKTFNFPLSIQGRINDLTSSDVYGRFFEQEKLTELWDEFQEQNRNISKIFGSLV
jgi:hypothetical protein